MRERMGLSLTDLSGTVTGLTRAAISRLENGWNLNPTLETLFRYVGSPRGELEVRPGRSRRVRKGRLTMASLRKRGRIWYYRFTNSDGVKRERRGCSDKRATEEMARAAESEAAKIRDGLVDAKDLARRDHRGPAAGRSPGSTGTRTSWPRGRPPSMPTCPAIGPAS